MHRRSSWKNLMDEEAWLPRDVDPKHLQELEHRRASDIVTTMDPKVLVSCSSDIKELPLSSAPIAENFFHELARNAQACGFKDLRIVQRTILPYMNAKINICISTTGRSGKTIGYLLPLIQRVHDDLKIIPRQKCCPRAMILVPTKEQGKSLYDTIRALTADIDIKTALHVSQMGSGFEQTRDHSDIIITTAFQMNKCLELERYTLAGVKMFVVDVFDYLANSDKEFLSEACADAMFNACFTLATVAQLVLVSSDSASLSHAYWRNRLHNIDKMAVLNNDTQQKISPSNHLLVRVRGKFVMDSVLETMRNFDEGPTMVVVGKSEKEAKEFSEQLCRFLESHKISAAYYSTKMKFSEREALLTEFNVGKIQVLVGKYCMQMRSIWAIGIRQVIHVGTPFFGRESWETSYHQSSSAIAFNPAARSVVLCDVDDSVFCGKKIWTIFQLVRDCSLAVDWPPNYLPDWAARCEANKSQWTPGDQLEADRLNDLARNKFQAAQERKLKVLCKLRRDVPPHVSQVLNTVVVSQVERNSRTTGGIIAMLQTRGKHQTQNNQNFDTRPNSRQPQGERFNNRNARQEEEFNHPQHPQQNNCDLQYQDQRYDQRRDDYRQQNPRNDNRHYAEDVRYDESKDYYAEQDYHMAPPSNRQAPSPFHEDHRQNSRFNDQDARYDQPAVNCILPSRSSHPQPDFYDDDALSFGRGSDVIYRDSGRHGDTRDNREYNDSPDYYEEDAYNQHDQSQQGSYNDRREDGYGNQTRDRMVYGSDMREYEEERYDQDYGRSRQNQYLPPHRQENQNYRQNRQEPPRQRMESDSYSQCSGQQEPRDLVFTRSRNSRRENGGQGRFDPQELDMGSPREYDDYYEDRSQRNSNLSRQLHQMSLQDQHYVRQENYDHRGNSGRGQENYKKDDRGYRNGENSGRQQEHFRNQDKYNKRDNRGEYGLNRHHYGPNETRRSYRKDEGPSNMLQNGPSTGNYQNDSRHDELAQNWNEPNNKYPNNKNKRDEQKSVDDGDWSRHSYSERNNRRNTGDHQNYSRQDVEAQSWNESNNKNQNYKNREEQAPIDEGDWSRQSYSERSNSGRGNRDSFRQDQYRQGPSHQNRRTQSGGRVNRFAEQDRINMEKREQDQQRDQGWRGVDKEVAGPRRTTAEEPQSGGWEGENNAGHANRDSFRQEQIWQGPSNQNRTQHNRRSQTGGRVNRFAEQDCLDMEKREQNQRWEQDFGGEEKEVAGPRRTTAEEPQSDGWGNENEHAGGEDMWKTQDTGEMDWEVEEKKSAGTPWQQLNQVQGSRAEEDPSEEEETLEIHPVLAANGGRITYNDTIRTRQDKQNVQRPVHSHNVQAVLDKRRRREAAERNGRLTNRDETPILGGGSDEDDPLSMW